MNGSENLLAFWQSRQRQTPSAPRICHELARQGRSVCFSTCDLIVQQPLRAKRDAELDKLLKKLSRFDARMIDDFGYVGQNRNELEVQFTLMAYRHGRGCTLLTGNSAFSEWDVIFNDPVSAAVAINRPVHHGGVPEVNVGSYRGFTIDVRQGHALRTEAVK